MPRPTAKILTESELRIMRVLWSQREATVLEVTNALERDRGIAYNTVLTTLKTLRNKGYVGSRRQGRRDVYRAVVSRRQAAGRALRQILTHFYEGSSALLAQGLIDQENLDEAEWRDLWQAAHKDARETDDDD